MPGGRLLVVFGKRVVIHPGKEIMRVVVWPQMTETEPPMLVLMLPPLGGAVRRRGIAARPFAARQLAARPAVLVGLHPDAVEQRRVGFPGTIMRTPRIHLQAFTNGTKPFRRTRGIDVFP